MRVAIVGSGVSGLSALWMLKQYSEHEVNIYEKNGHPGGHAHSVEFRRDGKEPCFVDTGFTSFNPTAAPNLLRFLKLLGAPLVPADKSLSVSRDGKFGWSTNSSGPLLSVSKLFNPRAWRTTFDTVRFNHFAIDLLLEEDDEAADQITIGQYLAREGYSRGFFDDYLLPLISFLWFVPDDHTALSMPANVVIAALADNGMLQWITSNNPRWMAVQGGAKTYVDAITSVVPPDNLHLNTDIVSVSSLSHGVKLVEGSGREHIYDHVILATPSNVTLEMLRRGGWASPEEEKVLRAVEWTRIESEVHWDDKGVAAKAAHNYSTSPAPPAYDPSAPARTQQVSLTLDMNTIQRLPRETHGPVRVTINPVWSQDPASRRWSYDVPYMVRSSAASLRLLPEIQNTRRISYIGAWTRRGRHEDGFSSAMSLVTAAPFDAVAPFAFEDNNNETNTTSVTSASSDHATRKVVRTKARAGWVRGAAVMRAAISTAERVRRVVTPAWPWIAWPVVVALAIARISARLGGWRRLESIVGELRNGWRGA